jgi:AcrR family transcriptional regulator
VQREEKSERSRRLVLDAALQLFSTQGFRGTSVREIADAAGVSTGNLYHHFPDKESIFRTLLDEYRAIVTNPKFPMMRAFVAGRFPNNLEQIGFAARDSVRLYRKYMALHYVDVIEFDGSHIRDFYAGMAQRFAAILDQQRAEHDDVASRLRPGVSAISALMVTTRMFLNYFQLEILFGVPEPFGKDSAQVVAEIADMLRQGIGL